MRRIAIVALPLLALGFADFANAQDVPPPDILNAIVRKLVGTGKPARTAIEFRPQQEAQAGNVCRMQPFDMQLMRNDRLVRSYSVMLDSRHSERPATPREFFAVLSRITVDADGSKRAYHPDDPDGAGMCEPVQGRDGRVHMQGVCALDKFSSGGTHVFRGAERLAREDLVTEWRAMWPQIRDRKLKSFDLRSVAGPDMPKGFYLFYWRPRNLTVVFRDYIITKDANGYPCLHDAQSGYPGYFVAATTLNHIAPSRADGCAPQRFIDSETVPFFVLPKGGFGNVGIGDVMVAKLRRDGVERVAFGFVADAGPAHRLGEGSIALNAALLGKTAPVRNMRETWALDISGGAVAVLVLGGTREQLNGNYSRQNVEAVARREFARWGGTGEPMRRFDACLSEARVNPK